MRASLKTALASWAPSMNIIIIIIIVIIIIIIIIIKMIVLCPCHSHNARILIAKDKQVNKIPLKKLKKIGVTIPNS